MPADVRSEYCCCQVFPIYQGVYLIALHCVVQASYGVTIILTSYYKPKDNAIVYVAAGCHLFLIPTAVLIFWSNLYENWKCAKACCYVLMMAGLTNMVTAALYFGWFINFKANTQQDKAFFWKNNHDWITSSDLPFTFWHFFSFLLIPTNLLWLYYANVMSTLSSTLKEKHK